MALLGLEGLSGLLAFFVAAEVMGGDGVESFLSGHCSGEGCLGAASTGEVSKGWCPCGCVRGGDFSDANCEASGLSRCACCRSSDDPFS